MKFRFGIFAIMVVVASSPAQAVPMTPIPENGSGLVIKVASCKSYSSCAAAVRAWCAGRHPRADGDGDGIPCENVCKSRQQVKKIAKSIGCKRGS